MAPGPRQRPSQRQRQGPPRHPTTPLLLLLLLLLLPTALHAFHMPSPVAHATKSRAATLKATTAAPAFDAPRNGTEGGGGCPFHAAGKTGAPQATKDDRPPYAPGPIRWPLLGNMLSALVQYKGIDKFDAAMQAKYGPIVRTKLLGQDWHIVSDPYLAREILITRAGDTGTNADGDFADRFIAAPIKGLFGNKGIIFANNQEWATNRRLSLPAFHRPEILDRASAVVVSLAKQMAQGWEARLRQQDPSSTAASDLVVDLHDDMRSLTLEAVAQASFSLRLGLLERDRPQGREYSYVEKNEKDDKEKGKRGLLLRRFTGKRVDFLVREGFRLMGHAIRFPVPFAHKFRLNPPFTRLTKVQRELQAIEASILETRRAERADLRARGVPLPPSRDLLDVYLEAMEQAPSPDNPTGPAQLDDASIFRNIADIFLAGSDTTATTISATLFEIVRRPQVLARVEAELASLDIDNPAHMLPHALAQRLPYLERCIKETLRLYPVAINLSRVAVRDTTLGGYRIRKGAVVSPSVRNMHLDKGIWGADAEEYRPERWEGAMEGGLPKGVPQGAYIPFGAGPRVCLGMRFALTEALAVSAVLLKTLKLRSIDPQRELDVHYPAAMSFRGGVPVVVEGRK